MMRLKVVLNRLEESFVIKEVLYVYCSVVVVRILFGCTFLLF